MNFSKIRLERTLFYLLGAIAVVYAFLAGFKTITEFDLGWQMATGRWIIHNHQIPSTEVLSYTAAGQPWIYPVGAGLIFYGLHQLGGYALLSWLTALVSAATVMLLIRRGSAITAALAIFAVPLIASRATARAELFTLPLFAATLSLLWEQRETGKARLWLLPLIFAAWVNLHPGFIAGLGLLGAYAMFEIIDMPFAGGRDAAVSRLKRAIPWMFAAAAATLLNPWGWTGYEVLLSQEQAMAVHSQAIIEWAPIPMSWAHIAATFSLRDPDEFYILLLIVAVAAVVAVTTKQYGAALLIAASAWFPIRHVRLGALFGIIVVIVAGSLLEPLFRWIGARIVRGRLAWALPVAASLVPIALAGVRINDTVTDWLYNSGTEGGAFGAGLSWWFPQTAADFILKENLPGPIFNGYNEGGFIAFALGPKYKDYVDGRAIPFGTDLLALSSMLKSSPPDSPAWTAEIARHGINTMIVPIGRFIALQFFDEFKDFCSSDLWAAVYLDEVSVVFVRRTPENQPVIERLGIECSKAPVPPVVPAGRDDKAFNVWANAGSVLYALDRKQEASAAVEKALAIYPQNAYLHFQRGHMREDAGDFAGAEKDYVDATRAAHNLIAPWSALADFYEKRGRLPEAIECWRTAADVSRWPWHPLQSLGWADLMAHRPQDALKAFDDAANSLPEHPEYSVDRNFMANLDHGRARCWFYLGDLPRAITYEERAAQELPENFDLWRQLGDLYAAAGRRDEANRAHARAMTLR